MKREARLILDDGTVFSGWSFGYEANTVGEVVFNTAMMGYPESLTDPSYAGQILVMTFPLVGNYGVPDTRLGENGLPLFMESGRIHPKALVVADYSEQYSHWNAKESLASWLKHEQIPAITGIDTRRLTKVLREHGVMMGRIVIDGSVCRCATATSTTEDYGSVNWVVPQFFAELGSLLESFGDYELTVIQCDCEIQHVERFDVSNPFHSPEWETYGHGGTDFRPPFEYVAGHSEIEPSCFIYITDGCGPAPENPPPYPVLWILTDDGEKPAPWGWELRLKSKNRKY